LIDRAWVDINLFEHVASAGSPVVGVELGRQIRTQILGQLSHWSNPFTEKYSAYPLHKKWPLTDILCGGLPPPDAPKSSWPPKLG